MARMLEVDAASRSSHRPLLVTALAGTGPLLTADKTDDGGATGRIERDRAGLMGTAICCGRRDGHDRPAVPATPGSAGVGSRRPPAGGATQRVTSSRRAVLNAVNNRLRYTALAPPIRLWAQEHDPVRARRIADCRAARAGFGHGALPAALIVPVLARRLREQSRASVAWAWKRRCRCCGRDRTDRCTAWARKPPAAGGVDGRGGGRSAQTAQARSPR
ncbi:hypothetical protein GCM10010129_58070 [Streptomyces fumigatiscleroticus]|nr:hypothetical protein GCM10010129_58070 [Streptomyces fumigatiscleroticus]